MARFQLAGPAADVSETLYVETRKLYGEPKRIVQYLRTGTIRHSEMLDLALPQSNSTILSTSQLLEASKYFKLLFA